MKVPTLDTYIAPNATNVLQWCTSRWSEQSNIEEACDERHRTPSTEFDYKASLSPKSFLNEEHHWSVPFTEKSDGGEHVMPLTDWWAVKASKGNGGKDVWVVNRRNFEQILSTIPPNDEYIIQRYTLMVFLCSLTINIVKCAKGIYRDHCCGIVRSFTSGATPSCELICLLSFMRKLL